MTAASTSLEHLPFGDSTFDAAMAIFSVHHWTDLDTGLAELRRVARRQVILLDLDTWGGGDRLLVAGS